VFAVDGDLTATAEAILYIARQQGREMSRPLTLTLLEYACMIWMDLVVVG
jgi:hypothetical protein